MYYHMYIVLDNMCTYFTYLILYEYLLFSNQVFNMIIYTSGSVLNQPHIAGNCLGITYTIYLKMTYCLGFT